MLDTLRLMNLAARLTGLVPGEALHRAGLRALHERRWDAADQLFEQAALRYRRELRVEAIARTRVHQLIARGRRGGQPDATACLEVDRLMYRLANIERIEPPFELADACKLLATWNAARAPERSSIARDDVEATIVLERAA